MFFGTTVFLFEAAGGRGRAGRLGPVLCSFEALLGITCWMGFGTASASLGREGGTKPALQLDPDSRQSIDFSLIEGVIQEEEEQNAAEAVNREQPDQEPAVRTTRVAAGQRTP